MIGTARTAHFVSAFRGIWVLFFVCSSNIETDSAELNRSLIPVQILVECETLVFECMSIVWIPVP